MAVTVAVSVAVPVAIVKHQSSQSIEQNEDQVCVTQVSSLQNTFAQSITNVFFGLSAVSIRQCNVIQHGPRFSTTALAYICSKLVESLHTLPFDALCTLMQLSWLSCHFWGVVMHHSWQSPHRNCNCVQFLFSKIKGWNPRISS